MSVQLVEGKDDLNEKLEEAGNKLVVIDFYTESCNPCKMIAPKLEECAAQNPDVVVLKVDIDENTDLVKEYNIDIIPTIIFVKKKAIIKVFTGSQYEQFLSLIESLK